MRNLRMMEILTQKGPACGTTSLAMIIRFLSENDALKPSDIDREIRRLPGMFSAPLDLISYSRRRGLKAEQYNSGTLEQLEALVNRGIPAMALLDLTPVNALDFDKWHWVVVVDVTGADDDKKIVINNPWGRQEEWEQTKFIKEWARLRMMCLVFGYDNYYIAVGTGEDILPVSHSGSVYAPNAAIKGLADVLNGYAAIRYNGNLSGLGRLLCGAARLIYGAGAILVDNFLRLFKSSGH